MQTILWRITIIIAIFLGGSAALWGQAAANDSEVAVSATRILDTQDQAPPTISVISATELAARKVETVADALDNTAGLTVNNLGASGSQKTISIRGSTSNQVLVLVDGVRVNQALSGLANVDNLPVENIERIEVIRSGSSAAYGSDALGGVVNIITKTRPQPLSIKIDNGSFFPATRLSGFGFQKKTETAAWTDLIDAQSLSLSAAPQIGDAVLSFSAHGERAAHNFVKA